jgi:hypothetical protein
MPQLRNGTPAVLKAAGSIWMSAGSTAERQVGASVQYEKFSHLTDKWAGLVETCSWLATAAVIH